MKFPLPFAVATVQGAVAEFLFNTLLGKTPPLNRDQVTMLREDNIGNGAPARNMFKLPPRNFRDEIAAYLT